MPDEFAVLSEGARRIVVTGEIDAVTAPELSAAIPDSGSVWLANAADEPRWSVD